MIPTSRKRKVRNHVTYAWRMCADGGGNDSVTDIGAALSVVFRLMQTIRGVTTPVTNATGNTITLTIATGSGDVSASAGTVTIADGASVSDAIDFTAGSGLGSATPTVTPQGTPGAPWANTANECDTAYAYEGLGA